MKKIFLSGLILALFLVGCTNYEPIDNNINNNKQIKEHSDVHLDEFPMEEISNEEIEALSLAINDEYKARATYKKIIDKFGDVKPFANIINSEENHIQELIALYDKYDLEVPQDEWYDKVDEYESVHEACLVGVEAEIINAALYDELFSQVDNQDIIAVFTSLRDASEKSHLLAFQKCVAR